MAETKKELVPPGAKKHRTTRAMVHNGKRIAKGERVPADFKQDLVDLHVKEGNIRPETPAEAAEADKPSIPAASATPSTPSTPSASGAGGTVPTPPGTSA